MRLQDELELLLEFLNNGHSFTLDGLKFEVAEKDVINVIGWSKYCHRSSITRNIASQEIMIIQTHLKQLFDQFEELFLFFEGKKIIYNLWFDESGKGSHVICTFLDGKFEWFIKC